jgi:hypothetical protein
MDEAIDLAIEGRSPYPEKAAFIDADAPRAGHAIERAADQGLAGRPRLLGRQHASAAPRSGGALALRNMR